MYFVTEKASTKVSEIRADPAVALIFSNDAAHQWVTLSANAEVSEYIVYVIIIMLTVALFGYNLSAGRLCFPSAPPKKASRLEAKFVSNVFPVFVLPFARSLRTLEKRRSYGHPFTTPIFQVLFYKETDSAKESD